MNFLALITAKADSERVSHKNLQIIAGKELYKWAIDFIEMFKESFSVIAFSSDDINKFIIPSNFLKIQRPPNLCEKDASHKDVIIDALIKCEYVLNKKIDYVVVFEPTNPFRDKKDILKIMYLAETMGLAYAFSYYYDYNLRKEYIQECEVSHESPLIRSGNVYLYSPSYLCNDNKNQKNMKIVVPKWRGYNINTKEDFFVAEALYRANND